jgi:Glucose-6-phosphate dehydrogenase subunit
VIRDATIRDVERELAELRAGSVEDDATSLRTSVMTHVAWVPEAWTEAAMQTLGGLEERHPSRTILLLPHPGDPRDALDAEVDLRCFAAGGRSTSVCFEVLQIHLCGPRIAGAGTVVAPLLIADLPAFLRWRGDLAFGTPELEQLAALTDRLVVDSSEWADPDRDLARLPALFEHIVVSDIAWARLFPWRSALADLWPGIREVEAIRVEGPRAEALLLAGWLSGRLGRDLEVDHDPADELVALELDGEPVERAPLPPKSPSDLLSDQLEIFSRDRVYEEAVRSFSRVAT